MQTQCTHCGATFKVTQEQLAKADGRVRCGSCKKVFNALQGLQEPVISAAPAMPAGSAEIPSPYVTALEKGRQVPEAPDDTVFQDDPNEDAEDQAYTGKRLSNEDLSDDFQALSENQPSQKQRFADAAEEEDRLHTDESWAEAMLQELHQDKPEATQTSPREKPLAPAPGDADAIRSPEAPLHADPRPGLNDLRPEPLQVSGPERGGRKFALLWWLLGSVLLLALIVQGIWLNWDRLVRQADFRDLVSEICQLAPEQIPPQLCDLPDLVDLEQLRGEDLFVRPHPTERNGLILDALVINGADFPQPLPALDVRFYDINDNILAQRTFLPEEYLSGQATGLTRLEPEMPLQVALLLENPGATAANYTLDFLPAESVRALLEVPEPQPPEVTE